MRRAEHHLIPDDCLRHGRVAAVLRVQLVNANVLLKLLLDGCAGDGLVERCRSDKVGRVLSYLASGLVVL